MTGFWEPIPLFVGIAVVGLIIGAIGAGIADEKRNESLGNGIASFGLSIMAIGILPIVVRIIGYVLEYFF